MSQATVIAYQGSSPSHVTGRIVHNYDNGSILIEDERGVRYFAFPRMIVRMPSQAHNPSPNDRAGTLF